MSEHQIELIRDGYDAWNKGDRQWVLDHMRPDIEWVTPPDDPEPGVFRGYRGVQQFWDNWRELLGQLRFDLLGVEDLGGGRLLVTAKRLGIGNVSGIEVEEEVIQIFEFDRDDKCFRVSEFYDREHAIAAAVRAGQAIE